MLIQVHSFLTTFHLYVKCTSTSLSFCSSCTSHKNTSFVCHWEKVTSAVSEMLPHLPSEVGLCCPLLTALYCNYSIALMECLREGAHVCLPGHSGTNGHVE